MKEQIWQDIISVRTLSPLVHNITNYVVMNNTANALLAAGASPVMAHAHSEVADMVSIANSLVINIGTLDEYWVKSMHLAIDKANELQKPWVLDPVGAGATPYRDETLLSIVNKRPTIIRGNASEIMALANKSLENTKGVDSIHESNEAVEAGHQLNKKFGSIICISGATDIIISEQQTIQIHNGDKMMSRVTGLGCTATALVAAFAGVLPDNPFRATISAMALMGVTGELAAKESKGPGSLQVNLLDKLYTISKEEFTTTLEIE